VLDEQNPTGSALNLLDIPTMHSPARFLPSDNILIALGLLAFGLWAYTVHTKPTTPMLDERAQLNTQALCLESIEFAQFTPPRVGDTAPRAAVEPADCLHDQ
jgi:hypothetical protein